MIDIKLVKKNPKVLIDSLIKRGFSKAESNNIVTELLNLDHEVKQAILQTENLQAERNKFAKQIGELKAKGLDANHIILEVEKTKTLEAELTAQLKLKQQKFENHVLTIPNILHSTVPEGKNELDNKIIKTYGDIPNFNFTPNSHDDLGEDLGLMDFKTATKISGSRFVILKDKFAKLERAIANFMLDHNTEQRGFTEFSVPVIVNAEALYGTGQLPKFSEEMFKLNYGNKVTSNDNLNMQDKWLISTSEIVLTNFVQNSIVDTEDLPLHFTALTNCFRSEAGSAGKDTKGMLRQHQFSKVELVSICSQEQGEAELEYILASAEAILQALKLPYRVVLLCGGDTGFSAAKTYDIEVWLPSQNMYREISSCSVCTDFQARRLKARTKAKNTKNTSLVNTLNGSALAVGRTLIAVLENYQQQDGSIQVPEVLLPYMADLTIINKKIITKLRVI